MAIVTSPVHSRRAADHQRTLNDVVGREIAAGVDLGRARPVDPADLLIRARDQTDRPPRVLVLVMSARPAAAVPRADTEPRVPRRPNRKPSPSRLLRQSPCRN